MANDVTVVYIRLVRGAGDMIMLRPAIIGSMKQNPQARHVIHCLENTAPLVRDIQGLEIVTFDPTGTQHFDMGVYQKLLSQSKSLISKYGKDVITYELISECQYETDNAPYIIENGKYVPTGKKIMLSRQVLWCDAVGVSFDMQNYNVKFFPSEYDFADRFLRGLENPLVIHLKSVDKSRSYQYIDCFIEFFAKKHDGHIVVLDHNYHGTRKNVIELKSDDIRKIWCAISVCKILIGIDSFAIHAGGSTNVFTYGIFGQTDYKCRLLYPKVAHSNPYIQCPVQPCWYQPCKHVPCMNARTPKWYWNDIEKKGLLDDNRDYLDSKQ
jgi:ADP-heptose:LPS heptosyltransferase